MAKQPTQSVPLALGWQPLERTAAHGALREQATLWRTFPIRERLERDPQRVSALTWHVGDWYLDLSKQAWDSSVLHALLDLARTTALSPAIAALFAGEPVNLTERRAALHMAYRGSAQPPAAQRDRFVTEEERLAAFVAAYRIGALKGFSRAPLDTVVNIGIGGSDLGPRLVCDAFAHWGIARHGTVRFVANLDPSDFLTTTLDLDPARTLFLVTSKSFSTAETLSNARLARSWLARHFGVTPDDPRLNCHFVAVTNAVEKAEAHGFDSNQIFWLPEWVGGRYSLWSAVGLPIALAYGWKAFAALRAGAAEIDRHFQCAPLEANIPVILGLLSVWFATYLAQQQTALLPYAQGLQLLPAWYQQLEMESNGKRVRFDGSPAPYPTAMAVWGMAGTMGQHAFHQWFYQGTQPIAIEFVAFAPEPAAADDDPLLRARADAAAALAANAVAQAEALLLGRSEAEAFAQLRAQGWAEADARALAPFLAIPGNRPSSFLLATAQRPETLGQLLALYEHATFVRGWLWGVNPFDQFGVELGKQMARQLETESDAPHDPSTAQLLTWLKKAAR
ncbi:glucose-6-phosphate isomerase [Hydrogenophilus thiooxidans]|uniref:glucose-6-phosphate isomerase n=1 Tax=Hydrogenophilus thiooxidans TaxID=2820326 RepID=UPI001C22C0CB|nr:glucose-6-phosphate isomerase [Hydrogenophilus thiooxidans]